MKANQNRYYLAYGSNLNLDQMAYRCPGAKIIGTSEIPDYRLVFKGSRTGSYLTIEPFEGGRVPVGVWSITQTDEENLDRYEGYPVFYYKALTRVRVRLNYFTNPAFENITGLVYVMRSDRAYGMPTRDYVMACAEGYDAFGFDRRVLKQAVEDTKKLLQKVEENA